MGEQLECTCTQHALMLHSSRASFERLTFESLTSVIRIYRISRYCSPISLSQRYKTCLRSVTSGQTSSHSWSFMFFESIHFVMLEIKLVASYSILNGSRCYLDSICFTY
ncbi:unnamed protein product [Albugo candida]|uniref:Uncharacterized protein n=1 Tax=Albugo candida TaxID=65357 RepID=A0A024GBM3_9STRA|nr:unnamed protein product [Albugo candida]|eukprot:CCI43900.1 unnamed protein product [Albugo candida]